MMYRDSLPDETALPKVLNFENFPCGSLPETHEHMKQAMPCPACKSNNIVPVSDCHTPPVLAIACEDCGEIEGDAPNLRGAVANWNRLRRSA